MLVPSSQTKSIQRALFADPHPRPEWRELSPDVKEKILRLLVLLLRQHGTEPGFETTEEEACDE